MKFSKRKPERILILGSGLPADRVAQVVEKAGSRYQLVGFVDDQPRAMALCLHRSRGILGPLAELQSIVEHTRPDRIVIALSERRGKLPVRNCLSFRMNGIVVEDWVDIYERITGKIAIESLSPGSLLFSKVFETSRLQAMILRSLDVLYASFAILFTAPLLAVIAVAIRLDSEGPVLFVHKRMGYRGKPFDLLKFRTMTPTSERTSEWARDNDARVTRVGKLLRRYRLDELPQFVNILAGQMSLVGPRPHPVTNTPLFFDEIPYYLVRAKVRPGITGWAQIRFGYANDLDEETEKMRYDLYYIKHQSVGFDLRILFETIWIVTFGRGSEQTTEASDYEISRNQQKEHEYGWQTTYKGSGQLPEDPFAHRSSLTAQHLQSIRHSVQGDHSVPSSSESHSTLNSQLSTSSEHSAFNIQPSHSPSTVDASVDKASNPKALSGNNGDSYSHLSPLTSHRSLAHRSPLTAQHLQSIQPSHLPSTLDASVDKASDPKAVSGSNGDSYSHLPPLTSHRSSALRSPLTPHRASPPWLQKIVDPSDLGFYDTLERQLIAAEIRDQLGYEPLVESRNRRRLHDNPLAPWELRADRYRIFYEAEEESHQVTVVAVGHKEGNRLFLRGQEVVL